MYFRGTVRVKLSPLKRKNRKKSDDPQSSVKRRITRLSANSPKGNSNSETEDIAVDKTDRAAGRSHKRKRKSKTEDIAVEENGGDLTENLSNRDRSRKTEESDLNSDGKEFESEAQAGTSKESVGVVAVISEEENVSDANSDSGDKESESHDHSTTITESVQVDRPTGKDDNASNEHINSDEKESESDAQTKTSTESARLDTPTTKDDNVSHRNTDSDGKGAESKAQTKTSFHKESVIVDTLTGKKENISDGNTSLDTEKSKTMNHGNESESFPKTNRDSSRNTEESKAQTTTSTKSVRVDTGLEENAEKNDTKTEESGFEVQCEGIVPGIVESNGIVTYIVADGENQLNKNSCKDKTVPVTSESECITSQPQAIKSNEIVTTVVESSSSEPATIKKGELVTSPVQLSSSQPLGMKTCGGDVGDRRSDNKEGEIRNTPICARVDSSDIDSPGSENVPLATLLELKPKADDVSDAKKSLDFSSDDDKTSPKPKDKGNVNKADIDQILEKLKEEEQDISIEKLKDKEQRISMEEYRLSHADELLAETIHKSQQYIDATRHEVDSTIYSQSDTTATATEVSESGDVSSDSEPEIVIHRKKKKKEKKTSQ